MSAIAIWVLLTVAAFVFVTAGVVLGFFRHPPARAVEGAKK